MLENLGTRLANAMINVSGKPQMNAADLALLEWNSKDEQSRQRAIQQSRNYYDGEQTTYLSARLREILDLDGAPDIDKLFHLNICDKVVHAVAERLHVTGFTSKVKTFSDWAWETWEANRTDAMEWDVYEGVRRDGEFFIIVDVDENGNPRFTPHQRFVDPQLGGDGYGCRAYYPNGDPIQPMTKAVKRWTAYDEHGKAKQRMTVYYPDHIEKYEFEHGGWEITEDDGDEVNDLGFVPWVANGKPLGIPVIHFRNRGIRCEIDNSVVSMQNLLNKTLIDLAESADQTAFRVWLAFGFIPTTDGKSLDSTGSNRAKVEPNRILGTTKSPAEASMQAVPGESPMPLIDIIERIMKWVAQAKDIPLSRLQFTAQVASAETQKQQDAPLLAVVRQMQTNLGNSWEDAFYMARRLANVYGSAGLDETAKLQTTWASAEVRADDRDNPALFWQAAAAAVASGVPIEVYLKRMGWTDDDMRDIYDAQPNDQLTDSQDNLNAENQNDIAAQTATAQTQTATQQPV